MIFINLKRKCEIVNESIIFCLFISNWFMFCESSSLCETPIIEHGTLKSRRTLRRVTCDRGYKLHGPMFIYCARGKWSGDRPICARDSCSLRGLIVPNGRIEKTGAALTLSCQEGFELYGNRNVYCDGRTWDRTFGTCKPLSQKTSMSCDFETQMVCGWFSPFLYETGWRRVMPMNIIKTYRTGPSHDHTISKTTDGHYMLVESYHTILGPVYFSSPTYSKQTTSVAPACFEFYYFMYGAGVGSLYVFIKPVTETYQSLWLKKEKYQKFFIRGNQNNSWHRGAFKIEEQDISFSIVFGTTGGTNHLSDIAIDDVKLMSGDECKEHFAEDFQTTDVDSTVTDEAIFDVQSCSGRCGSNTGKSIVWSDNHKNEICSCHPLCILEESCCPDYASECIPDEAFDTTTTLDDSYRVKWVTDAEYDAYRADDEEKMPFNKTTPDTTTVRTTTTEVTTTTTKATTAPTTKTPTTTSTATMPTAKTTPTTVASPTTITTPTTSTSRITKPTTTTAVKPTTTTTMKPTSTSTVKPTTTTSVKPTTTTTVKPTSTTIVKPTTTTTMKLTTTTTVKPIKTSTTPLLATVSTLMTTVRTSTSTKTLPTDKGIAKDSNTADTTTIPTPTKVITLRNTTETDVHPKILANLDHGDAWVVSEYQPKKASPLSHGLHVLYSLVVASLCAICLLVILTRYKHKIKRFLGLRKEDDAESRGYVGSTNSILTIFNRTGQHNGAEGNRKNNIKSKGYRRHSGHRLSEKSCLISDDDSECDANTIVLESKNSGEL